MHYPDYVYFIIIIAVKNNVNIKEDYMSRKGENIYKRKDGRWEGRYKKGNADNGRTIYGSCYGKTYREVKETRPDISNLLGKFPTSSQSR